MATITGMTPRAPRPVAPVPEPDQLVRVRGQHWLVTDVNTSRLPDDELATTRVPGRSSSPRLSSARQPRGGGRHAPVRCAAAGAVAGLSAIPRAARRGRRHDVARTARPARGGCGRAGTRLSPCRRRRGAGLLGFALAPGPVARGAGPRMTSSSPVTATSGSTRATRRCRGSVSRRGAGPHGCRSTTAQRSRSSSGPPAS